MKAEEIERLLANRPSPGEQQKLALAQPEAAQPVITKPTPKPLQDLFEQIEPYIGSNKNERDAIEQRHIDAREVRGRLPVFLRTGTWTELAKRVKDARLLQAAREWTWKDGNVIFLGETSIGKTTAAAMLFRRVLGEAVLNGGMAWEDARSMRWFKAYDLAIARKEHQLGRGEAPEIIEACSSRLLVIDDLGWENGDVQVITEVLGERHDRCYPTVFTTGRTNEQLVQMYGAAASRRMLKVGIRTSHLVESFPSADSQP